MSSQNWAGQAHFSQTAHRWLLSNYFGGCAPLLPPDIAGAAESSWNWILVETATRTYPSRRAALRCLRYTKPGDATSDTSRREVHKKNERREYNTASTVSHTWSARSSVGFRTKPLVTLSNASKQSRPRFSKAWVSAAVPAQISAESRSDLKARCSNVLQHTIPSASGSSGLGRSMHGATLPSFASCLRGRLCASMLRERDNLVCLPP